MTDAQALYQIKRELALIRACLTLLVSMVKKRWGVSDEPDTDEKHDSGQRRHGTGHPSKP